ncbi:hypothetical protein ACFTY7_33860 [Streptomyces sp. NPDC057062]|uniref:hypothetical protein n=1 Tax=unclassified Streptomyces TaxID=2593676 RepID=UPI001C6E02EC|nr:hypothetical protein [Streptomyces sp. MBT84]
MVRVLVPWAKSLPLRRLEYVLRPWTDRGRDAWQIAADLNGMCSGMRWRPARPDLFIAARIDADQAHELQLAAQTRPVDQAEAVAEPMANAEWSAFVMQRQEADDPVESPRTDADRAAARLTWDNWPEVAAHCEDDPDDALDLYGVTLCQFAIGQRNRGELSGLEDHWPEKKPRGRPRRTTPA